VRFKVEGDPIVERIDAILPQTQCGQCGYAGCRPYAEAIAVGEADINQCPPGGENGIVALAELLGREPQAAQSGQWRRKTQNAGGDRRAELHRLHPVHSSLSGGRHSRRGQAHAHRHRQGMHRLRTVPGAVSGGLHSDAAGRANHQHLEMDLSDGCLQGGVKRRQRLLCDAGCSRSTAAQNRSP
jgi:hypothetical protein